MDEALIARAHEERALWAGKMGNTHMNVYILEGGKVKLREYHQGACFSALVYMPQIEIVALAMNVTSYRISVVKSGLYGENTRQGKPLADEEIKYVDFVINRSTFADAFLTKDAVDVLTKGFVVNVELSSQFINAAACTIRYIHEWSDMVDRWNFLSQHCDPNAALLFMHMFRRHKQVWHLRVANDGHQWFNAGEFSKKSFTRFVNKDLSCLGHPLRRAPKYYNVCGAWKQADEPKYYYTGKGFNKDGLALPDMPKAQVKDSFGFVTEAKRATDEQMPRILREMTDLNYIENMK